MLEVAQILSHFIHQMLPGCSSTLLDAQHTNVQTHKHTTKTYRHRKKQMYIHTLPITPYPTPSRRQTHPSLSRNQPDHQPTVNRSLTNPKPNTNKLKPTPN